VIYARHQKKGRRLERASKRLKSLERRKKYSMFSEGGKEAISRRAELIRPRKKALHKKKRRRGCGTSISRTHAYPTSFLLSQAEGARSCELGGSETKTTGRGKKKKGSLLPIARKKENSPPSSYDQRKVTTGPSDRRGGSLLSIGRKDKYFKKLRIVCSWRKGRRALKKTDRALFRRISRRKGGNLL